MPWQREERRGLRLWPVGTVLVLAFTAAIAVAAAVFFIGWNLLNARGLKPEHRIDSETLFDLVKLSFGVVAGAGALVALVVAYRRQRLDEDGALREATRLHTERFTAAVAQLGEESAAVRLGGVHALAGLADDAPTYELRQTCIDVLCAYLRLPYASEADLSPGNQDARHTYLALREVRHTVIRLIRDHLRLSPEHPHSWQGHYLNLSNVIFDGGDFSRARFAGGLVDFSHSIFSAGTVDFRGAGFDADRVDFSHSVFSAGTVDFRGAGFDAGRVDFAHVVFSGGEVTFNEAAFSGATVSFSHASFSGGTVTFSIARFLGGTVDFTQAVFDAGCVEFLGTVFRGGTVNFFSTKFSGATVRFRDAAFNGATVEFGSATFSGGSVDFANASFCAGSVAFLFSRFSADVVRFCSVFSGGEVDLSTSSGVRPSLLVRPTEVEPTGVPAGLILPPPWYPTEP